MEFEPKIVGFLCKRCSYKAADLAGEVRVEYPSNLYPIRVPCAGRIDPALILKAFEKGIDGILIVGCRPDECHHVEGNLNAKSNLEYATRVLERAGISQERLRIEWISASEAPRFVNTVIEMVNSLTKLGPIENKSEKLIAARASLEDMRMRWLAGKARILTEKGNVYDKLIPKEEFDELMDGVIDAELIRNIILSLVTDKALSVKEMAKQLDLDPAVVLKHVSNLRTRGLISLDSVEERSPLYVRA